jgi:hypothetical protein
MLADRVENCGRFPVVDKYGAGIVHSRRRRPFNISRSGGQLVVRDDGAANREGCET